MNELPAFLPVPLASEVSLDQVHSEERGQLNIRLSVRGVNGRLSSRPVTAVSVNH